MLDMDPFLEMYVCIDRFKAGEVTYQQIEEFIEKREYDPAMLKQWIDLFDRKNTGKITLATMLRVLNLNDNDVLHTYKMLEHYKQMGRDINIVAEKMSKDSQLEILEKVRQLVHLYQYGPAVEMAEELKRWLNKTYGNYWHVTLVRGDYWSSYSHSNSSFHFHLNDLSYLLWRTSNAV